MESGVWRVEFSLVNDRYRNNGHRPRRGDPCGRPLGKHYGFAEIGGKTYPLPPGDRKGRPYADCCKTIIYRCTAQKRKKAAVKPPQRLFV